MAVGDPKKHPEFAGTVASVDTRDSWREVDESPANQDYHYNRNAETYMLIGDALGRAMVGLLGAMGAPSLDPSQHGWYEQYKSQKNAPKPEAMRLNTDPEPDLAEGFAPLFNGTDLTGWTPRGGTCEFGVQDLLFSMRVDFRGQIVEPSSF